MKSKITAKQLRQLANLDSGKAWEEFLKIAPTAEASTYYKELLIMKRNLDYGFEPVFIDDMQYFYYQCKHIKSGKIYQKNQLTRIIKHSYKIEKTV